MNIGMRKGWALFFLIGLLLCLSAQGEEKETAGYYQPREMETMDVWNPDAPWCFQRSLESEHFLLFWEAGFGEDPNTAPPEYRVDGQALLERAEGFYRVNVETLGMKMPGKSWLDTYKMQIYLFYTPDWLATGAGYDNVIGALWVSPSACADGGSVLAHEIAHCFQYQIYCDQLLQGEKDDSRRGFRYGYAPDAGNGFWEQCAQWASFVSYPREAVDCWEFSQWPENCHRAFEHEWTRYQSYWLPMFLTQRHGMDAVGRLWRESRWPEDALSAYCRIFCGGSVEMLNRELYDYAARMALLDFPVEGLEAPGGVYSVCLYDAGEGWQRVAYGCCPGEGGFNVIELPMAPVIQVEFQGLAPGSPLAADDPGWWLQGEGERGGKTEVYNSCGAEIGWRYGFCVLHQDGRKTYAPAHSECRNILRYTPDGTEEKVYLAVVGVGENQVIVNPWDEDERTDAQMPYQIRISSLEKE